MASETTDLKALAQQAIEGLTADPGAGQGTAVTTVTVRDGMTCDIADGGWRLIADEMPGDGGAGLGPDPGVFARASLGACLAMGYVMWAAQLDVKLDAVEVVVEADYDARGQFGIDSVAPGWTDLRYTARIRSSEPEQRVREVIEAADRCSPLLDDFQRPRRVTRTLEISAV